MVIGKNKMNKIIPTVFATNKKEFNQRFNKIVSLSPYVQIDIMDGELVESTSISPKDIPSLTHLHNAFEAHLMVKDPEKYLSLLKQKGFQKIIIHYEAFWDNKKLLDLLFKIRDTMKLKAFVAINPETSIAKIYPILAYVDGVLLMGVHPGREHQKFITRTYHKISELRARDSKIPIQIDGGVSSRNLFRLKLHGANIFNSGSFISESKDPKSALQLLQTIK